MDVEASFVADGEAAKAVQPGENLFGNPAMTSKRLAGFDTASCDAGLDAWLLAGVAASAKVVGLTGMELGRSGSGPALLPADGGDGIQQLVKGLAVVDVGLGQQKGELDALPVGDEMVLGSRPAAIGRVEPVCLVWTALQFAVQLVPNAAACQSRNRRQHVTPELHAVSCGRISHGVPVRGTNRMPISVARSSIRRPPPFGLAGSTGSKGAIIDHRASETSGASMSPHKAVRIGVQGF